VRERKDNPPTRRPTLVVYLIGNVRDVESVQRAMAQTSELGPVEAEGENGVRGHVVSGDRRFLDTFDANQPRFRADIDGLRELVGADANLQERVRRVDALYAHWLRFARDTIAMRQSDVSAAATKVTGGEGKQLTDGDTRRIEGRD
jgi:CHASE3 domain sensor protein